MKLVQDFDDWLTEQRPDGASLLEMSEIVISCYGRMRFAQTLPQLHKTSHALLAYVEWALQNTDELDPVTKKPRPRVLAEHWQEVEGGYELARMAQGQITDEDIDVWLNGE